MMKTSPNLKIKILMKIVLFQILLLFLLLSASCKSSNVFIKSDNPHTSDVAKSFKVIPQNPVVLKIQQDTFMAPSGGHIQGIQQLDKQHLVISGSSDAKAYFFIASMKGIAPVKKRGIITKMVYINDDFPEMRHNHASGFQLANNLLAIGTEGGSDTIKSSIVFYDLSNPNFPKPLNLKINRQEDTAGAIGLINIGDKMILAVGGWDSDRIDFYVTNTTALTSLRLDFKLVKTWRNESKNTTDWVNTSCMIADLYEVHLTNDASTLLKKIDSKRLFTMEGVSFKNGAGLSTFNAPRKLNMLATERNWNPLIRVNYW